LCLKETIERVNFNIGRQTILSACNGERRLDVDLLTPKHIPVGKPKECQTEWQIAAKESIYENTRRENG